MGLLLLVVNSDSLSKLQLKEFHSSIPETHSQIKPNVSTVRVSKNKPNVSLRERSSLSVSTGNKRISSTSKITKIKATRKKCTEKNKRLEFFVLNPHSKGVNFSESQLSFHLNPFASKIRMTVNLLRIIRIVLNISINIDGQD